MPITVVDWPVGVPDCIVPMSPTGGFKDNRYSFDPDANGVPIERPSNSWAPEVFSVEMAPMSISNYTSFMDWYKNDLKWGVLPFKWVHPITKEVSAWKIVKGDPPFTVKKLSIVKVGSGKRRISVSFTVMSYPASFEPEYTFEG